MKVTKIIPIPTLGGAREGGRAVFSDGKSYEYIPVDGGYEFKTAPAYGTHRTRIFESPKRNAALVAALAERG